MMHAPVPSATSWIRPRISRSSQSPKVTPTGLSPLASAIPRTDQMSQAALPLLERPVRGVAVADQPAQEGAADQVADFVGGPRADVEDGGGRTARPTASAG